MDNEEFEQRLDNLEQIQNQILDNQEAIKQLIEEKIKVKVDFIHFVLAFVVVIYVLRILSILLE
ncbi:MAG: hypothetical protein AAF298_15040 [Cyanobacteria bacterium P01_A01_bin.40]